MKTLTAQQAVAVAARLFAIWLVFRASTTVIGLFTDSHIPERPLNIFIVTTTLAIMLFIAAFLWKFPVFVAKKLLESDGSQVNHVPLTESSLYSAGFVILGTYFLYWAISDCIYWFVYWLQVRDLDPAEQALAFDRSIIASMAATAADFALSLFLIFGANWIKENIFRLRQWS